MPATEGRRWYGAFGLGSGQRTAITADPPDLEGHTDDAVFGGVSTGFTSSAAA
jgi:hypothetical protein